MRISEFKQWLISNTSYSKRVISNIISRLNRANRIQTIQMNELYLFELEHTEEFKGLSVTVRSQLRKAVRLYLEFEKGQKRNGGCTE